MNLKTVAMTVAYKYYNCYLYSVHNNTQHWPKPVVMYIKY